MTDQKLEALRYPIGKFIPPATYETTDIQRWISDIEELPSLFRNECRNATEEFLNETYKPGGWTSRQVIHHVSDSHMNAYMRFKLALTEDLPTIRPYLEDRWAELEDSKNAPPEISLSLLEVLHKKWILTLRNMKKEDFERKYFHPESNKEFTLKMALALYSWHGKHHLEHIRLVKRKFANANV